MKFGKPLVMALFSYIGFSFIYALSYYQGLEKHTQASINLIEKRIALDLPRLRLANHRFNTVAHSTSISIYLDALNQQLTAMQSPIEIISLQGISSESGNSKGEKLNRELETSDQSIPYVLRNRGTGTFTYISIYPLIATLLIFTLLILRQKFALSRLDEAESIEQQPLQARLVIDLLRKSIRNGINETEVHLSNKPFCFYIALIQYCMDNPNPQLNHSKNVPDDLIGLANKYFYRLIELGHTKRKRPDFSTNLDKTLSEIRATLDEVFHDFPDEKDRYYPPKAQGEGSRSKLHNYALEQLIRENIEFIGK